MRRLLGAVSAALLVVVFVAAGVVVVENRTSALAANLGYPGATVWIHVMDLGPRSHAGDDFIDFVDQTESALAYTPSSDSALLTLYDPRRLFRGPQGPLYEPLAAAGHAPAALVSDRLGVNTADVQDVLPAGTRIVGAVSPGVGLAGASPMVIRNREAGPLGGGLYVLAGDGVVDARNLLDALEADGAWISDATVYGPIPVSPFDGARAVVLTGLLVLFVLLSTLVVVLDVTRGTDRLRVAAILGARGRDLRRLLWRRAAPPLAVGAAAGVLVVLAGLAVVTWRLMTDRWLIAETIAVAAGSAVAWSAASVGGTAWWQAWRCARAVSR